MAGILALLLYLDVGGAGKMARSKVGVVSFAAYVVIRQRRRVTTR